MPNLTITTSTRNHIHCQLTLEPNSGNMFHIGNSTARWDTHSKSDPIHSGITHYFQTMLKQNSSRGIWAGVLSVGALPIHLKYDGKYYINGQSLGLKVISSALARVAYLSATGEEEIGKLMSTLLNNLDIPESISYVLENRAPYHFFTDYVRHDVRLNVQAIGVDKYAIEVSDSIWGEITKKDLVTFVNSYRNNSRRGKWHSLSPNKLFCKLMGREPTESERKLMVAFLSQNRTKDIVERRAKELVSEICTNFPTRFFSYTIDLEEGAVKRLEDGKGMTVCSSNNEWLFIRGNKYDWKIRKTSNSESRQSVTTQIYQGQVKQIKTGQHQDEDGDWVDTFSEEITYGWSGPICVDNMNFNGALSVGDQMVARGFTFMNDNVSIKLVSTIQGYIRTPDMSEHRLDFEDLLKNDLGRLL